MRRKKEVLLFSLLIVLIYIICISFVENNSININKVMKTRKNSKKLVSDIYINSSDKAVFDKDIKTFYFTKDSLLDNFKLKVKSKYKVNYKIVKEKKKKYLFVYSKKYYEKIPIVITNLPILNIIYYDEPDIDYFNNQSRIETTELYDVKAAKYNVDVQMLYDDYRKANIYRKESAVLNIRGTASALFHPKKSYRIQFSKKTNVFNIVKDDVIALDGVSNDNSKIRNILSSDIWNLMNDNQNINNDLVGDFVEVFINSHYVGIYVVKNKVNKGTLGIDNDGLLVKDIAKNNDEFINLLMDDNYLKVNLDEAKQSGYYLNYQVKYYNYEAFMNYVKRLRAYYKDKGNYDVVNSSFYINNYVNYILFVALISGKDNIIYNKYYSLKTSNSKILLTPWDMDLTWGLDWSYDLKLHSVSSIDTCCDKAWIKNFINNHADKRLYKLIRKRYLDLRKGLLTTETINKYIDNYEAKIIDTGAYKRDRKKWNDYDIKAELKMIRKWVRFRIRFLDEYFGR